MTKRRVAYVLVLVVGLVFLIGALFVVPVVLRGVGLYLYSGIRLLFPSTISWGDKDGFIKCSGAIANPGNWPREANYACLAMHLCANEAVLSENQKKALYDQIHKTPGCQEP